MQFEMNPRQAVAWTMARVKWPDRWTFGRVPKGDDAPLGSREHPFSFQSECECPSDCLRDHENE